MCEIPTKGWTRRKRKGKRIRTKLIEYIELHTEGQYSIGPMHIAFEKESDYIMYKLRFPT